MTISITMRALLLLSVFIYLILCTPTLGFGFHKPLLTSARRGITRFVVHSSLASKSRRVLTTTLRQLSADDEFSNNYSREREMMDQVLMEQEFQRIQRESLQPPSAANSAPQQRATNIDPLIASLTRIDEPTPNNIPMVQVPLFGEIPADGTLGLLAPAAAIGVLGFLFSIVVAFNSRDAIVEGLSEVEFPKMEYTPTVVEEGKCRGLCSSQAEDLDGLRNFMESISRK